FYGQDGNDSITYDYNASSIVDGGAGNDTIKVSHTSMTSSKANTITGGTGNDVITAGHGAETYLFRRGDGQDVMTDFGGSDTLSLEGTITNDQLWFRQTGNSLEVSVIGTTDKVTINNWYSNTAYHVEQFKAADGKTLTDSQVQNLVDAMAAFAPPAPGQTSLPSDYRTALDGVIAANWQ
ncbi:hypothetical protein HP532_23315, partial [Pseudomonas sp. CrR25]|nr:hypothetical protein [Pseudomonas sp. CrR25]